MEKSFKIPGGSSDELQVSWNFDYRGYGEFKPTLQWKIKGTVKDFMRRLKFAWTVLRHGVPDDW